MTSVLRALATTVVPEAARLTPAEWNEVDAIVTGAVNTRPKRQRRQLAAFLLFIEWLPVLAHGRRFSRLDPARRTRLLERLQAAPLVLVRRGVWGLRTVILKGYYGRPAAAAAIGYRAQTRGWEARR